MEKMYRDRPKSQHLFAVSWRMNLTPFYYYDVKDCVGHQMELKRMEDAGWIFSKKKKGEDLKRYRIQQEAYRRVKIVFAPDIAQLEKNGGKMTGYEKTGALMPAPPDPRVTQLIDTVWETLGTVHSERGGSDGTD